MPSHVKRPILHPSPKGSHISHGHLPYGKQCHRTSTHRWSQTSLPQVMGTIQQLTTTCRDPPVPDTRDPPVSCTTSEGVKHYSYPISGPRTQSILHLLFHSHIHIRQRGNRYPYATTRFTHSTKLHHVHRRSRTTWLRRRQLPANIPHSTRETTHSPHIYTTHSVYLP